MTGTSFMSLGKNIIIFLMQKPNSYCLGYDEPARNLNIQSPKIWLVRDLVKFVPAVV